MIRLGDTVDVNNGSITKMWLVKNMNLKRMSQNIPELIGKYYVVLGFIPGKGWMSLNNGSLADMRAYIKEYRTEGGEA